MPSRIPLVYGRAGLRGASATAGGLGRVLDLAGVDPPLAGGVDPSDEPGGLLGGQPAVPVGVGLAEQREAGPPALVVGLVMVRGIRPREGVEVPDFLVDRRTRGFDLGVSQADRHRDRADGEDQPADQREGVGRPPAGQHAEPRAGHRQRQADRQGPGSPLRDWSRSRRRRTPGTDRSCPTSWGIARPGSPIAGPCSTKASGPALLAGEILHLRVQPRLAGRSP